MSIKVGVLGAAGRMGATVCAAVAADPDLELVAVVDASRVGESLGPVAGLSPGTNEAGLTLGSEVSTLVAAGVEVAVDFTIAAAARANLPAVAAAGIHAVVGTTGFTDDDLSTFDQAFSDSGVGCVVAANFAISAVLMMRFAELAAPFFDTAEIIEYHHNAKIDAPSGTAVATAQRLAAASSEWADDPTQKEVYPGARGGQGPAGIRVHGVRMHGMLAHQEVILGAEGQTLTIRQDSYDRSSFMPGVILACKRIGAHAAVTPGLTGLDPLLDI